jgi:hypothetical protein
LIPYDENENVKGFYKVLVVDVLQHFTLKKWNENMLKDMLKDEAIIVEAINA